MQVPEFTVEHLKKLPLRAIVAFAARCARRVEQLAQLPEGHPQRESRRAAVEAALSAFTAAVEAFASVGYHNEDFVAAARNDYDTLVRLELGHFPEAGTPVDLSPCGPLGRL